MSDTAHDQAIAQVESIVRMVAALELDYDRLEELRGIESPDEDEARELAELEEAAGGCESEDDARQRILEDALSVEVRSSWHTPGESPEPSEFRILLCTGGPHVEIVGELDDSNEPCRARVLYRDWSESGELFVFDRESVLTYCRCFYFG